MNIQTMKFVIFRNVKNHSLIKVEYGILEQFLRILKDLLFVDFVC